MGIEKTALLLEDDDFDAAITKELLENCCTHKFEVKRCSVLSSALDELTRHDYPVALIDMNVHDSSGLETVREVLHANPNTAIIVLTGTDDTHIAVKALEMGAQDFLPKTDLNSRSLERTVQYSIRRKSKENDLNAKAYFDSLTGIGNRALLYERWKRSLSRSERATKYTGVLIIDVDKFKDVNDTFGHHVGDLLLRDISEKLLSTVRDTDIVARLGGDEFVIVLENIDGKEDIDAIRDKLMHETIYSFTADDQDIIYSVSIGGTLTSPADHEDLMAVLRRADVEMYEFKTRHEHDTKSDRRAAG